MIYLLLYVLFGALDYTARVYLVLSRPERRPIEFEGKTDSEVKEMFFITAMVWPLNWVVTVLFLVLPMKERD